MTFYTNLLTYFISFHKKNLKVNIFKTKYKVETLKFEMQCREI